MLAVAVGTSFWGVAPSSRASATNAVGVLVASAPNASAIAADGDGVMFTDRLGGRLLRVSSNGTVRVVATVPVRRPVVGQRGLLGLAIKRAIGTKTGALRSVFVSYVDTDGRLVVGAIDVDDERDASGPLKVLWIGRRAADLANGGTLRIVGERLLVSLGQNITGDGESSGRIISLPIPKGAVLPVAPSAVSIAADGHWHNPYGFDAGIDRRGRQTDELWVADNAPREEPERIVRVHGVGPSAKFAEEHLPVKTAPSSLVVVDTDRVALCGYVSRRLELLTVRHSGAVLVVTRTTLADDCAVGLALLPEQRLAYGTGVSIKVVQIPSA